ncbi:hypothetical protein ABI59_16000 [Acidobacteria bacterium Mor1]|nr:hypothetical protein ABI59_16000 [Acidobacteria bacterium Mor1]
MTSKHQKAGDDPLGTLLEMSGGRPAVPGDRADRARRRLRSEWRHEVSRRRRRRLFGGALAAAAALAAMAFLATWNSGTAIELARVVRIQPAQGHTTDLPAVGTGLPAESAMETATGERMVLALNSGHEVRIDQESTLRLMKSGRLYLERGAVYVVSGSHAGDPGAAARVTIETPLGRVEEIGTRYEVRISEEGRLSVRVREGRVDVHLDETMRLEAGQRVDIAGDRVMAGRIASDDPAWTWSVSLAAAFPIDGRRLSEFLDHSARELGLELTYDQDALAAEAETIDLSGSIEGMLLDDALASVLATCGMEHRIEDGKLKIHRTS